MSWEIYGKTMGNLWEIYGKSMGNLWENYGKTMGNLWENYGKFLWENGIDVPTFSGFGTHITTTAIPVGDEISPWKLGDVKQSGT